MKTYTYQNNLVGKKQLKELLALSFTNYDSMQACALADELKYLGFKYASQAGISISIEDLKIPFAKNLMLEKANQEIINSEKIYFKGKLNKVERFQKIIDTWSLTSESLKEQVIYYFKNYDPLNSVYMMAFSGARGNLSQVRQLVGMRGLMSDPSGQIMNLPIKKNFREGLTITDYLMSGYGARKGIIDTALKTANSGYLTRRLIDVGQDILIREKDCLTTHSFLFSIKPNESKISPLVFNKLLGRILSKTVNGKEENQQLAKAGTQITPKMVESLIESKITHFYTRSPLTCNLYRAICQKCYGWDLSNESIIDIGEAVGILAGQSIGEPGTQLTMRTFHTGGIFTSKARQQVISPLDGIIRFSKMLKTVTLRTNRGEDVLITKNSGSIVIIPNNKTQNLIQIKIQKNTILFPKNHQFLTKNTVIAELVSTNKQIKTGIKPILSDDCGEIVVPRLKKKVNLLNNNKLIWILSGQLYNSPKNSFVNFYPDYKINSNSYIFRTKLINHFQSTVVFINQKKKLNQRLIQTKNEKYLLFDSSLERLSIKKFQQNFILNLKNAKYLVNIKQKNLKFYLSLKRNQQIGSLVLSDYKTLTGGTVYYDHKNLIKFRLLNKNLIYYSHENRATNYQSLVCHRTIVWLGEEFHNLHCEANIVMVEHEDFISEKFELIPGLLSKTSGIVSIRQRNNVIQAISIKSGVVYEGKKFKNISKKLYYPGEIILSNIPVKTLSFCEQNTGKANEQIVFRPVELYEFPHSPQHSLIEQNKINKISNLQLVSNSVYTYKTSQKIKGVRNLNLISSALNLKSENNLLRHLNIEFVEKISTKAICLRVYEKLSLNKFIVPNLRYKNIESCFLIQPSQFMDRYTILGYLESFTKNSVEIVKFKVKNKENKQVFLISNEDCLTIQKKDFTQKTLDDLVINTNNINEIGKIIIENNDSITLQKGRPYFFPNCINKDLISKTNLQYKTIASNRFSPRFQTNREVVLTYNDRIKLLFPKQVKIDRFIGKGVIFKAEFSKFFYKKNGKLFSSLIPGFLKKLSINNSNKTLFYNQIIKPKKLHKSSIRKPNQTLLIQSSEIKNNKYKTALASNEQLALITFVEQPFVKTTKSVGIYSITEDFFEQDANSVFCKNTQFIEAGETLGLLNFEKEITGDIVQGLPRIEEILEARKKNLTIKRVPTSQKKGLLIQKTSLDPNFEFRGLGTTIKENEKINLHKLLKVYFNYYGLTKLFGCDRTSIIKYAKLIDNYEGSYKSFKKVQSFILNSVQSVYQSQGVTINDKHLEVIIRQMTTKVLITYEGNTPLLRREVIDLYHIKYINQIVKKQNKQSACYIPLLLGITKAALNNPSFISAASFQETTRVLTKAAIEGRIDWLRGLKENIIIGHLIPAGTGSQNYSKSFKKSVLQTFSEKPKISNILQKN